MINLQIIPEISGIYKFTNKLKNKVYIGQTNNLKKRISEHLKDYIKGDSYFYRSIKHHGIENFEVEILIQGKFSKTELNQMEISFIRLFKSNNPTYGYNMTIGGDGISGFKHTEESKEKIKKTSLGRKQSSESIKKTVESRKWYKHSNETKEKIRNKHLGKKQSEETKEKLKGRIVSQETREKLSKSLKGKLKGRVFSSETIEKNRQTHLGKKPSLETKEKMRQANLGKIASEESKKKMSESRKGKKHSEETKEKIRQSLLNKKNKL